MRRKRVEQPAHSHLIHQHDPAEEVFVQHLDGSYSSITIALVDDQVQIELRTSSTHLPRFRGAM